LVPDRNWYCVVLPLGLIVPFKVAFVLDTEVAKPVVAVGTCDVTTVTVANPYYFPVA
jgi:hypothetical protein